MPTQTETTLSDPGNWFRWVWRILTVIVCGYFVLLLGQLALRCAFPWDLFIWAESPFMTDLLKLDSGKPIYGPPADGNSFVYSPGLTYLTYALLKPLGLHLDIRYCRIVIVAVGILASGVAGLAARRAWQMIAPENRMRGFAWLGAGIALLVIFKNFTADITHPDNMVMFHTAGLLLLTLHALQRRSFATAIITMVFAALGVFTKQTLCVAFVGPALVFIRFKPWGYGRGLLLALLGLMASAVALAVLWRPEFAKFYTWEVLTQQKIHLTRFYWLAIDLLHADRGLLVVLAVAAVIVLWQAGMPGRQYLQIWFALGVCSVAPGGLAYAKHFGTWNNLIIHQLWLFLLVWPAVGVWFGSTRKKAEARDRSFGYLLATVLTLFVLVLLPTRFPADRSMYETCREIQKRVTADIQAGRRVMVAHGTMYQLNAGSKEIPLDRANSIVDLGAAGLSDRVDTVERIRSHYYDRLYLALEDWYDDAMRAAIHEHYQVDEIIPKPTSPDRAELGRSLILMGECKVMSPRADVPAQTPAPPATRP